MVHHCAQSALPWTHLTMTTSLVISQYICLRLLQASKKQKLFLMSWCPDTAKVKKKMLYSSSFDALKKSLVGVQKYIQVSVAFVH
jgi:Cofilin/tropomyosin-type actin-binding protein.